VSSGLRVGTPALATRGFDVDAFREVGKVIGESLTAAAWTDEIKSELTERTRALADRYPLYREAAAPAAV
jgi:glycine hydroxymethyltransferase